ncbi:ribonuclease kappa isoform X2 [Drosophila simulans]|nr:ribonuclease kappa isoform X2 [Drosophila simulans]
MKICGPKLSLCGLIISVWGIVQLVLMGLFFYINSVALIEDLPLEEEYHSLEDFYAAANRAYNQ